MTFEPCFECDEPSEISHHVVPKSRGGTRTVRLCASCHARAHEVSLEQLRGEGRARQRVAPIRREGAPPYGWRVERKARPRLIVPDPEEQAVLRLILKLRASRLSVRDIAKTLNDAGHRTKRGKLWHPGTLARIIENPFLANDDEATTWASATIQTNSSD